MTRVEIDGVERAYGAVKVLKGIHLDIEPGEFVVLLGPSGCGKSTLLASIAGLDPVQGGEIRFDGRDVARDEPSDREIGMVFQSYALYPTMTVRKNMSFALRVAGMAKPEIDERVNWAAGVLQIEPLLERKPAALSGGQRQRVAIGRALVRKAKVFLFDEPLSNLDAKLRGEMRAEIKALHEKLQTTFIYVTHDQIEAMTLATRIAVMSGGEIQQFGTPDEIYRFPQTRFVADFIGAPSMNFVDAVLRVEGGRASLEMGQVRVELDDYAFAAPPRDGQPVIFGTRPERITLQGDPSPGAIPARVTGVEPMGADTLVWLDTDGHRWSARVSPEEANALGREVHARPDPQGISLFEPESERRL
ncbi:ABC transporter ATP-binding protein [Oceaniglobus trochenteri]|uniref:ABC transporter ATP-binding protein n=1 Tax=Oceaniglobus trochenteri TaxID=2763260 RepID=UPI001D001812|nr:ABC transporter ATP-binding protein [Oceaniglobus trochenteri]